VFKKYSLLINFFENDLIFPKISTHHLFSSVYNNLETDYGENLLSKIISRCENLQSSTLYLQKEFDFNKASNFFNYLTYFAKIVNKVEFFNRRIALQH
jgi:hypothetical protein